MYKDLRKWDEAIKLAERRGYSDLETLQKEQMSFLLKTGQEEKAGQVLEARGDTDQAMTLYLKANQPTKAARLLLKLPHLLHDEELSNRVINALIKSGTFNKFITKNHIHFINSNENLNRIVRIGRRFITENESINDSHRLLSSR